jgi:hypothetical protein
MDGIIDLDEADPAKSFHPMANCGFGLAVSVFMVEWR